MRNKVVRNKVYINQKSSKMYSNGYLKTNKLICLFILFLLGCTHTRQFTSLEEINSKANGKKVIVTFYGGENLKCKNLYIDMDSTYIYNIKQKGNQQLETTRIQKIAIINRGKGAWEGFRPFLFGAPLLSALAVAQYEPEPTGFIHYTKAQTGLIAFAGTIFYGAIIGVPLGLAIGSREVYNLASMEPDGKTGQTDHLIPE